MCFRSLLKRIVIFGVLGRVYLYGYGRFCVLMVVSRGEIDEISEFLKGMSS